MSTSPANEKTYLRLNFLHQLVHLGKECADLNKDLGVTIDPTRTKPGPDTAGKLPAFKDAVARSQAKILEANSFFQNPGEMLTFMFQNQTQLGQSMIEKRYFGVVAGYALQLEGAGYTQISRFLKPWYNGDYGSDDSTSLARVGKMAEQVRKVFGTALQGLLPTLYKKDHFGDIFIQTRLYAAQADRQIKDMVEECRASQDRCDFWIDALKHSEDTAPEDYRTLVTLLTTQLMKQDIKGLEGIRSFVLGSAGPTGQECSKRTINLMRGILDHEANTVEVLDHLAVLSMNEQYRQDVLMSDLLATIDEIAHDYQENDRGNEFMLREETVPQLVQVLNVLQFSPEEMAMIAMRAVAGFNRGLTRDMQNEPVAKQLEAVSTEVFKDQSFPISNDSMKFTILSAIIKTLPVKLVKPMAQVNDKARAAIYTITGNGDFLAGIKDGKTLDKVMGADLGL
ncbi:hypothetical protein IFT48_03685 [Pseudomonas fluorescens]|uniref:hypothetical protein n=1 Tax=Pseudomonas fluorescens TaxID=294 RepID=UPI001930CDAE|nr:hypothetical protein [Pseudomonas fluorescens]MBD8089071.1 hypothetical protein [Pseudomonas fluorescens]